MSDMIFQRAGSCFIPQRGARTQYEKLPAGTYSVEVHDNAFHLLLVDDLGAPGKIYGSTRMRAERVVKSFLAREGITTGVLLDGMKGTGKTHLAKLVSEILRTKHNIPTLLIDKPYSGSEFNRFISEIRQPCFVLLDEAEKTYRSESSDDGSREHHSQAALLPLLDGAYSSHKLFMFITNEADLHSSLMDRPGRILYRWDYSRLEDEVVREYAEDNLKDKKHAGELLALMRLVQVSSFDVLKGLIWEINEYGDSPFQAVQNLNITWKPTRMMAAEVMGNPNSPYAGESWSVATTFDAVALKFKLNLDKHIQDEEEKKKIADIRRTYAQSQSMRLSRGLEVGAGAELSKEFNDTFLVVQMAPENLVNYLHEEDIYEFQNENFFVRLSGSSAKEKMADVVTGFYSQLLSEGTLGVTFNKTYPSAKSDDKNPPA